MSPHDFFEPPIDCRSQFAIQAILKIHCYARNVAEKAGATITDDALMSAAIAAFDYALDSSQVWGLVDSDDDDGDVRVS